MFRNRRGFTLIELLIVVAIIGILAAIAIPNFLEAQTKAKVVRCAAEMRELKNALTQYHVDWGNYPSDAYSGPDPCGTPPQFSVYWNLRPLTTPIEYISSMMSDDPFSNDYVFFCAGRKYKQHYQYWRFNSPTPVRVYAGVKYQTWEIASRGPSNTWPSFSGTNQSNVGPVAAWHTTSYDPSNGLISLGLIWSSDISIYGDKAP